LAPDKCNECTWTDYIAQRINDHRSYSKNQIIITQNMPPAIVPPPLKPGDTIAFVSPSARLNNILPTALARARDLFTSQGYQVRELFTPDEGIQSSITNRLSELRTALTDPSVSAVVCTIGGLSFTELLPALLADTDLQAAVRNHPKVVVGYSDITGLHWFLHATTGLRTFYGPCPLPELCEPRASDLEEHETSALAFCTRHLFRAITDPAPIGDIARSPTYAPDPAVVFNEPESLARPRLAPTAPGWTWLRRGHAQGRLFGGCLTVMARLAGVRAITPDWKGRIVFFETAAGDDDVSGNPLGRVRAAVADLIAQGVFDDAAGLVVGRPFGYDSPRARAKYAGVITGLLCEGRMADKNFPILFNVDIGHTTPMVTLPFDGLAVLDSERDRFAILDSALKAQE
jgi:muramoyltetrapeptide carboxypeptidase LdcA involved in peptidoglycan recycling